VEALSGSSAIHSVWQKFKTSTAESAENSFLVSSAFPCVLGGFQFQSLPQPGGFRRNPIDRIPRPPYYPDAPLVICAAVYPPAGCVHGFEEPETFRRSADPR
jgi:hypothetical protein